MDDLIEWMLNSGLVSAQDDARYYINMLANTQEKCTEAIEDAKIKAATMTLVFNLGATAIAPFTMGASCVAGIGMEIQSFLIKQINLAGVLMLINGRQIDAHTREVIKSLVFGTGDVQLLAAKEAALDAAARLAAKDLGPKVIMKTVVVKEGYSVLQKGSRVVFGLGRRLRLGTKSQLEQ